MVFPFFQYPGVLPLQLFQRGISVKVIIDIGVTVEHEQTAEPAHQLTRLLIFAKRLDRTNRQSGAVCRVETALQEQVEINPSQLPNCR